VDAGEEEGEGADANDDDDEDEEDERSGEQTGLDYLEECVESLEGARAQLQAAADYLSLYAQVCGDDSFLGGRLGVRGGGWGRAAVVSVKEQVVSVLRVVEVLCVASPTPPSLDPKPQTPTQTPQATPRSPQPQRPKPRP